MPTYVGTTWAAVEPGMTVIDRAGNARLILAVDRPTLYHFVTVTDASGTYELDPDKPALVQESTLQEAVIELLVRFPGSEIIA